MDRIDFEKLFSDAVSETSSEDRVKAYQELLSKIFTAITPFAEAYSNINEVKVESGKLALPIEKVVTTLMVSQITTNDFENVVQIYNNMYEKLKDELKQEAVSSGNVNSLYGKSADTIVMDDDVFLDYNKKDVEMIAKTISQTLSQKIDEEFIMKAK